MATYSHNSDDLTVLMTANNEPAPNVVSASSEYWPAFGAFAHTVVSGDGQVWVTAANQTTGWLKFDFGSGNAKTVEKYTLSFYNGATLTRAPKTWTLQGSNNDADWTTLDTQTNVPGWSASEMRTYEFVNGTAYRYYKINITANQGDATYLIVGELELFAGAPSSIIDLSTEIKAAEEIISDLLSSIIAGLESLTDLNSEIRAGGTSIIDLKSDIAADFLTDFADLSSEIRAYVPTIIDLNTAIEAVRSKWWLKTEIKAGCAARWNFNTEWNPNRFLCTQIAAKKPYEFSFKTQTDEDYAATDPSVEIKIPGYSFPLRTLFLDYISVGGTNEYQLQLWAARGMTGKGTLKNAKIKAEYIDTQDSGGYEVVTCDWISCKVNGGEYGTVNETPLALGDIPCDSKLDITLKVECRDCSLTRGLAFFKLIITGDWKEANYSDSIVYRDGTQYHSGIYDDYTSISFICRLYVV